MSFPVLLLLSALLGSTSFIIGILPLSFAFTRKRIEQLSTFGAGLLLGAALGIIIPEGIEAIYKSEDKHASTTVSLSLLGGFSLMLVLEQCLSPHSWHSHGTDSPYPLDAPFTATSDSLPSPYHVTASAFTAGGAAGGARAKSANPITFGLVIHSLADGLALGASSLPSSQTSTPTAGTSEVTNPLTLIVFLALLVHRAPASLALSTSLLPHLPRAQIRNHVAIFAVASPVGAIVTYLLLDWWGTSHQGGGWTGIALAFSGGTFLYVATVLSPVREEAEDKELTPNGLPLPKLMRVGLLLIGMFVPFAIGSLIGHGHGAH